MRFAGKLLLLCCTLLVGIILGMLQTGKGIDILENTSSSPSFYITKIEDGQAEKKALEEEPLLTEQMLAEKKEKWQQSHQYSKWSSLGDSLGNFVYQTSRQGVDWLIEKIDQIL